MPRKILDNLQSCSLQNHNAMRSTCCDLTRKEILAQKHHSTLKLMPFSQATLQKQHELLTEKLLFILYSQASYRASEGLFERYEKILHKGKLEAGLLHKNQGFGNPGIFEIFWSQDFLVLGFLCPENPRISQPRDFSEIKNLVL